MRQRPRAAVSPRLSRKDLVQARRLERSLRETEERLGESHGFAPETPAFAPPFLSLLHDGRGFYDYRWLAHTSPGFCGGARGCNPYQGQCRVLASNGA